MIENEVNLKCREYLEKNGFKYKGVLNTKPKDGKDSVGYGQVRVPDRAESYGVLLDHQGHNDRDKALVWIEAKGEGDAFSELLEGFIRLLYGVYHGGGVGLLATPNKEFCHLSEQRNFLSSVAKAGERSIGLFNAEKGKIDWLT